MQLLTVHSVSAGRLEPLLDSARRRVRWRWRGDRGGGKPHFRPNGDGSLTTRRSILPKLKS